MNPQTAMEAATEGAKVITKLQEIVQKMFGPHWTRRQADADAYADERKLQTIRDNPDMEVVYVAGEINARKRTPEELAQRAEQRMYSDSIRQEMNIENVIDLAAKELQHASGVSDESVDDDWITRLFSIVKDVSSEDMQYVWGKILAGEIVAPGSFSLRTIETIRNMGKNDAEIYQKILPLVVTIGNQKVITSSQRVLQNHGVKYSDIMLLDECGLVNSSGALSMNHTLSPAMNVMYYTDERILLIKNNSSTELKLSVGVYTLTKAGIELFNILSHGYDNSYILEYAAEIRNQNKKVDIEISVHQIININEDSINYVIEPIEKFEKED